MGFITLFNKWQTARRKRLVERLTAKAADISENTQYDLIQLHQRGFVRAKGTGESITKVHADIENLTCKRVLVVVTSGTYFVSSGSHQNMAMTTEYPFTLNPCCTEHLDVTAVCIKCASPYSRKGQPLSRRRARVSRRRPFSWGKQERRPNGHSGRCLDFDR